MKENLEMQTKDALVLDCAIGTIEANNSQLERLNEFCERVESGEFYKHTDIGIVCECVDGRPGAFHMRPNSAGGSQTIMVADDLVNKRFAVGTDGSTSAQYNSMLSFLHESGQQIGGHTAENVAALNSGCGANDKLSTIYTYISQHADDVRGLSSTLGVAVNQTIHDKIIGNASARTEFSDAVTLLESLDNQPGAEVTHLRGDHQEVLTSINLRPGTTLDRNAMRTEFPHHQVFNVDVWALENSARLLSTDETEVNELFVAMIYYNIATACVLGGKSMRVVVVD